MPLKVGTIWQLKHKPEYKVIITEIQGDARGDLLMICFGKDGYEHQDSFLKRYEPDRRK